MPTLPYVNVIYIGPFASVDEDENDFSSEGAANLLGNYDALQITVAGEHDRDDNGAIKDDEAQGARTGKDRGFLDYDIGF